MKLLRILRASAALFVVSLGAHAEVRTPFTPPLDVMKVTPNATAPVGTLPRYLLNALPSGRKAVETGAGDDLTVLGRSLTARARQTINVQDQPYNAKCDFSTDDTAAFQMVAAAASAGRIRIELPDGACIIRPNSVTFTGNLTELYGRGGGSSIIVRGGDGDGVTFAPADPTTQTSYLNKVTNVRILRDADSASGTGLRLVRQITFRASQSEVREFVEAVKIEGGSGYFFDHFTCQAGTQWPQNAVKTGSALVRLRPYVGGGVVETPSGVYFTQPECSGVQQTSPQIAFAFDVGAVDTLNLTGGHIGFAQVDMRLLPSRSNVGIQNVTLGAGAYFDGSGFGGVGLSIPAFTSGNTANFVIGVQAVGAIFQNHTGQAAVSVQEPSASVTVADNEFRNEKFWGVYGEAAGKLSVLNNTFTSVAQTGGAAISFFGVNAGVIAGNTFAGTSACVGAISSGTTVGHNVFVPGCSAGSIVPMKTRPYTVSTLPTCAALTQDSEATVTDAASPTYGATIAGGGSVRTKVVCDGTNWRAH